MDDEFLEESTGRWQFSVRALLRWTAMIAVACTLLVWLGGALLLVILGAAVGTFIAALVCPWFGLEYVLDDVRTDLLRCLAVGSYLVLGTWGLVSALKWLVTQAHGEGAPIYVSVGVLALFLYTTMLLAKYLWDGISNIEATLVVVGTLAGTFAMALAVLTA